VALDAETPDKSFDIEKVTMRLPDGMAERIDAIAGHNKRAAFVRALLT
jgi:predicted DNA-binding protein